MAGLNKNYILHLDGDSFFASCELAMRPDLRGKPVVVGQDRGIAVAFNKEAKDIGVTRGMPIFKIKKFYPQVIVLSSHFEIYKMYCDKFVSVVRKYSPNVEVYSIDECFATVPQKHCESYQELANFISKIKHEVGEKTGITFSFGVARTKVLAKVASKAEKPDGLTIITEEREDEYLKNTPIEKIWGIGYRTAPKLKQRGIITAIDFRDLPEEYINKNYAKPFRALWLELNGMQIYKVGNSEEQAKSLQATRSFTPALDNRDKVFAELSKNIETAFARARNQKLFSNMVYFFIKTSEFKYISAEVKFNFYTQNPIDAINEIRLAYDRIFRAGIRYRATGVTLANLLPKNKIPKDLFGLQKRVLGMNRIMNAVDHIREIYGNGSIILGSTLPSILRKKSLKTGDLGKNKVYEWGLPAQAGLPYPFLGEVA